MCFRTLGRVRWLRSTAPSEVRRPRLVDAPGSSQGRAPLHSRGHAGAGGCCKGHTRSTLRVPPSPLPPHKRRGHQHHREHSAAGQGEGCALARACRRMVGTRLTFGPAEKSPGVMRAGQRSVPGCRCRMHGGTTSLYPLVVLDAPGAWNGPPCFGRTRTAHRVPHDPVVSTSRTSSTASRLRSPMYAGPPRAI